MEKFREILIDTIKRLFGIETEPEVTLAPDNIEADYSSNIPLKLTRELHRPPMVIAEELAGKIDGASATMPGFINFKIADVELSRGVLRLNDSFLEEASLDDFNGKTVICEFSDPNPFKVLHVGHLYTSIMGDAISRLYENAGAKVIRANFGGDVGLHVAKTMYVLEQKPLQELTIDDIGRCYVEGTAAYEDDVEARRAITELNKEIYRINAENIHGTPVADLYWRGRELSYEYFDNFYASIGLKFDKYYPESTVAKLGLDTVRREEKAGVYEKSDGAVVFRGDKYGLHTRVFINKEGVPTYEAKDVGLIFQKDKDYHFDKSVVITGSEQLDYMKVVLKSVEQYAPELVEKTTHLTHGLVKLPGGVKMSSRKGNFLKAVDVLEMVRAALRDEFGSEDEKVSLAATKYAFLKYKMGGNIIFDPAESVKMTGNSGPYLLYSAVRAKKILSKARKRPSMIAVSAYVDGMERNLAKKLVGFRAVIKEATAEMAPHKLAGYLYELSQEFSRFYENCQVNGAPEEADRLQLVQAYLNVMTYGLELLGIKVPEEM
ncbi:arginine--tRNA ligase [Candidatus Saccharibacteria bacterium]|nr:arginine--tRNA ligase [Candidatus Saccharibacteria bacterium]